VGVHSLVWGYEFYLASAHSNMLKIWDTRFPRKALCTIKGAHSAKITSLDWKTGDNDLLLSAG
jgi:WD40 repeat protein